MALWSGRISAKTIKAGTLARASTALLGAGKFQCQYKAHAPTQICKPKWNQWGTGFFVSSGLPFHIKRPKETALSLIRSLTIAQALYLSHLCAFDRSSSSRFGGTQRGQQQNSPERGSGCSRCQKFRHG